jgi:hypothetical protein
VGCCCVWRAGRGADGGLCCVRKVGRGAGSGRRAASGGRGRVAVWATSGRPPELGSLAAVGHPVARARPLGLRYASDGARRIAAVSMTTGLRASPGDPSPLRPSRRPLARRAAPSAPRASPVSFRARATAARALSLYLSNRVISEIDNIRVVTASTHGRDARLVALACAKRSMARYLFSRHEHWRRLESRDWCTPRVDGSRNTRGAEDVNGKPQPGAPSASRWPLCEERGAEDAARRAASSAVRGSMVTS